MDEDTQDAAWAQQEQDERRHREDALIKRVREQTAGFRDECDRYSAEFDSAMRRITKGSEKWRF